MSGQEPEGPLSVADGIDPDRGGSELDHCQAVATTAPGPEGMDNLSVPVSP